MKKKIHSFLIVSALLITAFNSGCKYDEIVPEAPDPGVEVTFSGDILPIFNESCNISGCHGFGGISPDLSPNNAYNSLTTGGYIDEANPEQSELYIWVNGGGSIPMPVTGTDTKIANAILSWIEQGAQNN